MKETNYARLPHFRVWIAAYGDWQPDGYRDVPVAAIALEPAEEETMSAEQASAYAEAFNRTALGGPRKIWAVALPVTLRYEGEPRPGEALKG